MSRWGVAMCPHCDEPLVSTMAWDRAEFYCLSCGAHLGFLEPVGKPETPELLARTEALRLEFRELSAGALIPEHQRGWAKPEALAAHEEAIARLEARRVR